MALRRPPTQDELRQLLDPFARGSDILSKVEILSPTLANPEFRGTFDFGGTAEGSSWVRGWIVENFSQLYVYLSYADTPPDSSTHDNRIAPYFEKARPARAKRLAVRIGAGPDGSVGPFLANQYIRLYYYNIPILPYDLSLNNPLLTTLVLPTGFGTPANSSPAANTAASIVLPAPGTGLHYYILSMDASYSGAPTGGNLQILDGASVIFNEDITGGGPVPIQMPAGGLRQPTANTALTVTLAAGGAGVLGKVSIVSAIGA